MYLQLFSIKDSLLGLKDGGEGCREQCTTHPHTCTCVPPTCGSGVGQSAADVALGEASVVGFDRNQPNHLNPELWQAQVSWSKRQAGEAATSPTDGSRTVPAAPLVLLTPRQTFCPRHGWERAARHSTATLPISYSLLTLSSPGVTSAAGSSAALSEDGWLPSSWEMVELSETERALALNPCWHQRPPGL